MRNRRPPSNRERVRKRRGGIASAAKQAGVPIKRSIGRYKKLQTNDARVAA